jgi:hypothetical protein
LRGEVKRTTSPYIDVYTSHRYPGELAPDQVENICVITKVIVILFKAKTEVDNNTPVNTVMTCLI